MTRFDNLPTEELIAIELQMRQEREQLAALIAERFKDESPMKPGMIYRIVSGRFIGRRMLLSSIVSGRGILSRYALHQIASGPLDSKSSKAGDGWTIRHQQTLAVNLDPATLGKGPR